MYVKIYKNLSIPGSTTTIYYKKFTGKLFYYNKPPRLPGLRELPARFLLTHGVVFVFIQHPKKFLERFYVLDVSLKLTINPVE